MVRILCSLVLLVSPALTAAAAAQPPAAPPEPEDDPRAVEARKACAAGDVDKGIRLLADYLGSTDDPTAIYNMGRCYQQNGVSEKALLQFREYLRKAKDLTAEDRAEVEGYIRELEAEQAREAPALPEPPPAPGPTPQPEGRPMLKRAGLVLGGVGVLALGAGLVFALKVNGANGDVADMREKAKTASSIPGAPFTQRMEDAQSAATFEWIFLATGVAALAAGTACWILGSRRSAERSVAVVPWVGSDAGGGTIRVTF
jgi:hypothetical protein